MASYDYTFTSGDTVTPTKLNDARTVSDIVNADIKSDAAIAGTKIAPAFGAQNITVGSADRSITNTTNHALAFGTNNTERVRIDSSGRLLVGTSSTPPAVETIVPRLVSSSAGESTDAQDVAIYNYQNAGGSGRQRVGPKLLLGNSRSGTNGSLGGIVVSGDQVGNIRFAGDDGSAFLTAAEITAEVDGTPGTNDMPGRLVFSTTADGGSSPTERMRIDSSGNVGIGTTSPNKLVDIRGASSPEVRLQSTDGSSVSLYFGDQTDAVKSGLSYNNSTNVLSIRGYDNSERITIASTGNVGIGNTSPSVKLDVTGDINCSSAYGVDGVQVVANRRTGWTAATGTATRTTFATSTVTTAQLAERVKALIDDLSSHGLIGT